MDYKKNYSALIEKILKRQLTKADSIGIDRIEQAKRRLGLEFPDSFIQYYQVAGNIEEINQYHNKILIPEEFEIINDKLVFMEENQMVCYWGMNLWELKKDDPEVYQGQVNRDSDNIDWHPEEMSFSVFIYKMLEWEFAEN